jgi:2-polyprenyl-3-methyl-5-hydroxy-6-metoxy-1,4-benzoquinol methylase
MDKLEAVRPYVESAVAQLRNSPRARNTLFAILGLGVLSHLNAALSRWIVNNRQRAKPWQAERELALVTGGCSGIGKQIMEDMARTGVRVVIVDLREPNFALRKSKTRHPSDNITSA